MAKVKLLRSCAETQWDRAPAGEVKGDTLGWKWQVCVWVCVCVWSMEMSIEMSINIY
jgi:hypothetical protein